MMKTQIVTFKPEIYFLEKVEYQDIDLFKEPMLYCASWKFARERGGVLANRIMDIIEDAVIGLMPSMSRLGYHPVIDTKKYMLMPGMYRNIPGWHCDGVIRNDRNSQPNLDTVADKVYHFAVTVSDEENLGTEFLLNEIGMDVDCDNVWKSVDKTIEEYKDDFGLATSTADNGEIAFFSRSTLHRTPPATIRGNSYFFRLSFYHMPAMNQMRDQVQVYTDITQGW